MRSAACFVLFICLCTWNLSTASPHVRSLEIPDKDKESPAIPNDSPSPSPTPDLYHVIDAFKGGMTIDKVINLFKTFRMGSKFFKTFIENVPIANRFFKALEQRNVEVRVLTKYWLDGKFPDLRDIFDVVTAHGDIGKDARAAYDAEPQLNELRHLVLYGNVTDFATLNRILQLYYGRKIDLKPSQLTGRGAITLRNMINVVKFMEQVKSEYLFQPMWSSDYKSVLRYLLSLDYSSLLKIHALPQDVDGGKYTAVNGIRATDPAVLKVMGDIRGKYKRLLKGRRNSAQVEQAVYDILDQLVNIVNRGTEDMNKVFAIANGAANTSTR